jgi:excinuclease ABC subunit C
MHNIDRIKSIVDQSPTKPGIYKMLDQNNNVLYVGKAKNIKNRLKNYLNDNNLTNRIRRLMRSTKQIDTIITETEKEALLLEANLIKKIKPQYNILLRDDKSFPYIFINHEQEYPSISKHRGKQKFRGKYFGPFATVGSLNYTLKILQKVFQLRSCEDSYFENRSRPCLMHQIERCSAPCVDSLNKEKYKETVKNAEDFLSGKHSGLQRNLSFKMNEESKNENYEKAASYRDKIKALTQIQSQQNINLYDISDSDVISLSRQGDKSCIQVFIYRSGQNWGNKSYFPKHNIDEPNEAILERFVIDFYTKHRPPKEVLVSHRVENIDLIIESLNSIYRAKTKFSIPHKGKKVELIKYALRNSDISLNRYISDTSSNIKSLEKLKNLIKLNKKIKRIEGYDNSHAFGKNAVGAMVVFGEEGFENKNYRKFNIDNSKITPGDDYGMMRQVLTRRFSNIGNDNKKYSSLPEVILIDGGKGHYETVQELLTKLNLKQIKILSIYKGLNRSNKLDQIIFEKNKNFLSNNDPVYFLLQRIRDESHRFAIGAHRNKNKKDIENSELELIAGLGNKRRKLLLNHFGSVKDIKGASILDLEKVDGISKSLSEKIYNFFNN